MKIISKLGKYPPWFFRNIFLFAVIVTAIVGQENLFFEWVMPVYTISFMMSILILRQVPDVRLPVIIIITILIFLHSLIIFSMHLGCISIFQAARRSIVIFGTSIVRYFYLPGIFFFIYASNPRILSLIIVSIMLATFVLKRLFFGRFDWHWMQASFLWQQLTACLVVFIYFLISCIQSYNLVPGEFKRLTDETVYDLQIDDNNNILYYSCEENIKGETPGFYGKINLLNGSIITSNDIFKIIERFALLPEFQILIGCEKYNKEEGLIIMSSDSLEILSRHPLRYEQHIIDIVLGENNEAVYTISEYENSISRFDLMNKKWETYFLSAPWGHPYDIKYSVVNNAIYVSQWGPFGIFSNKIPVDDPSNDLYTIVGFMMAGMALDPENNRIFIARPFHSRVDAYSMDTMKFLFSLPSSFMIREIAYDSKRDQLYSFGYFDGRFTTIDVKNRRRRRIIRTPQN